MKILSSAITKVFLGLSLVGGLVWQNTQTDFLEASSHREAPMIAEDPLADNADLYAFRSPDNPETVTLLATYVPLQLPQGGPNYASFGTGIRYEVHVKNNAATTGDDITYRFTFKNENEDPSTFFNIRLGAQNLKKTYRCDKKVGSGPFVTIIENGMVPPPNIGPRSIEAEGLGLGTTYDQLVADATTTAMGTGGETIYCGPADDPFFVDLGGIFDLGQTRFGGTGNDAPADGVACKNVHVIAMQIPISTLQKDGLTGAQADDILDGDFVIGVWASASRQKVTTLRSRGLEPVTTGKWTQVSRLGMPLTNEAVIPIGQKDRWNALTPYNEDASHEAYFTNPELGLYMDDALFGAAVPALAPLRIQRASQTVLGNVDFGNGNDGLFAIKGHPATVGTALDDAIFGNYLLREGQPRSADLLPIFYTGVPNLAPYQLATGKTDGNPLSAGKPFINNFLPIFGDMLRLNMAVPPTPRDHPNFSSEGLIAAAIQGLTNPIYTNPNLQWIPNMDGFPNGRRLEDDVTRIELQAVGGAVLAAVGLWYDDRNLGASPLSQNLLDVLGYHAGPEVNDVPLRTSFPYVANPHSGFGGCGGELVDQMIQQNLMENYSALGLAAPVAPIKSSPNPFINETKLEYHLATAAKVQVAIYDLNGRMIEMLVDQSEDAGMHAINWEADANLQPGIYLAVIFADGVPMSSTKLVKK
jgi:Domain of unknown function (DUF4331)